MLQLKNITKDYGVGDSTVRALNGISIEFRKSEFVAVLGHSGCGKTTMLNIIGGLDRYTSGDLIINGKHTDDFDDADWDTYRNHSIGFVFQTYNLIPHQTVLSNVELALTLSGVSKAERRRRATEALEKVGLSDQLHKKPNQMSGGQMQRVAIARALVNDPEILLADEPTGALDSETSVQIMDILKEISKDRLIIMVTHNPELAETYATRIVRLMDGEITDDTSPYVSADKAESETEAAPKPKRKKKEKYDKHTSMSFMTALSLSKNNLMTKKARTLLTSFAGSIGIIGIALILALSNGIQTYINQVQEDTLSSYPITLQAESVDIGSMFQAMNNTDEDGEEGGGHSRTEEELATYVYTNTAMYDLMNSMKDIETTKNNLSAFRDYLMKEDADGKTPLSDYASSIRYSYSVPLDIYVENKNGDIVKADAVTMIKDMMSNVAGSDSNSTSELFGSNSMALSMYSGLTVWQEMLPAGDGEETFTENGEKILVSELLTKQYDVLWGDWPTEYNEVVLIVGHNNEINDLVLYSLGLVTSEEMSDAFLAMNKGEEITNDNGPWTFEEIAARTMKVVLPSDLYKKDPTTGTYIDLSATELGVKTVFGNSTEIKISAIVRVNEDALSTAMATGIGYTTALTEYLIDETAEREIVKEQLANPDVDVITGLVFPDEDAAEPTDEEIAEAVTEYLTAATLAEKAVIYTALMSIPSEEYISAQVDAQLAGLDRATIEMMVKAEYPEYESMLADIPDETLFGYVRDMMIAKAMEEYAAMIETTLGAMSAEQLAAMLDAMELTAENNLYIYENHIPSNVSESTYDENLDLLGVVDKNSPSAIYIYASTFADKDEIANIITAYNDNVAEEDQITYTDYVALLMSSITTILNAITYVLIAFVAISLVVSSIMIGIITYISVLERTKEIGILRSIGASKRDISRVFNAETLIVGFASGAIGIGMTLFLCIPINFIVQSLTDINNLRAILPWQGGVALVVISMLLTLTAGVIPARLAAKKDPVIALRTE